MMMSREQQVRYLDLISHTTEEFARRVAEMDRRDQIMFDLYTEYRRDQTRPARPGRALAAVYRGRRLTPDQRKALMLSATNGTQFRDCTGRVSSVRQ